MGGFPAANLPQHGIRKPEISTQGNPTAGSEKSCSIVIINETGHIEGEKRFRYGLKLFLIENFSTPVCSSFAQFIAKLKLSEDIKTALRHGVFYTIYIV